MGVNKVGLNIIYGVDQSNILRFKISLMKKAFRNKWEKGEYAG